MIRSALRSVSYLVKDVVSVARWAVGEVVAELDYRLQPVHVRQGWAAELADIEAGIDVHEPYAPYLQWGGPETWPDDGRVELPRKSSLEPRRWQMPDGGIVFETVNEEALELLKSDPEEYFRRTRAPYCNRCGYPHPTTQKCKRDEAVESKPVTGLYAKCSYPLRPNAVACSDMCMQLATSAVRNSRGWCMYRCTDHKGQIDADRAGVVVSLVPFVQSSPVVPPTAAGDHPGGVESGVSPHPETPSPGPDHNALADLIAEVLSEHPAFYDGDPCSCEDHFARVDFARWRAHVAPLIAERIEKAALPTLK